MSLSVRDFRCIIFDFDGVIAETDSGRISLLSEILDMKGVDSTRLHTLSPVGFSTATYLRKLYPSISNDLLYQIISLRQEIYFKNLQKYCNPFPKAVETIRELHSKIELQLATTNSFSNTEKLLNYLEIKLNFSKIFGREIIEDKNGIKDYNLISNKIGHNVNKTIIIEDSEIGVNSAKNAGFFCIGFNYSNSNLNLSKADIIVNNYDQIQELINDF